MLSGRLHYKGWACLCKRFYYIRSDFMTVPLLYKICQIIQCTERHNDKLSYIFALNQHNKQSDALSVTDACL